MTALSTTNTQAEDKTFDYVTVKIENQLFGIPVLQVQDVLKPTGLTRIPLAPPEIVGVMNLRGRIVTVVDVRTCLGLSTYTSTGMNVVVEHHNELYSLQVDQVGEVMSCNAVDFQPVPPTLGQEWLKVADGVHQLQGQLLVVLNIDNLLGFAAIEEE